MLRRLRSIILGGKSDKREAAWLVFLIINGLLGYAVYQEAQSIVMDKTWAFLMWAWPFAAGGVLGVHVQHFHAQARAGRLEGELE